MTSTPPGPSHTPAYDQVDLDSCAREPIHVPGAVQPHGVLLALDSETLTVAVASTNCEQMLGVPLDDVIGADLPRCLGPDVAAEVLDRVGDWNVHEPLVVVLPSSAGGDLSGREVDVSLSRSGERILVELETFGRPRSTMLSYQSARGAMGRLSDHATVEGLVGQLAREVRALTEFDRVMVYRFDQHWNGEVVAEERREDLNSFLGLHYPASDIPEQARRLYTVNWTRLIADVDYRPVSLHPLLDPGTGRPLDLTHSTLRSVSPIHLEYLSNMGVGASMSISLVIDDELWGLIACHHYSGAHRPSQDARAAAEFLGQVASSQIAERERADAREAALRAQEMLARISTRVAAASSLPLETLVADPELLELVGAGGAVLRYDHQTWQAGNVPPPATVERIVAALHTSYDGEPRSSDHLADLDAGLGELSALAAGALVIGSAPDRWLLWLRPELLEVVSWGGDPTNKELARTEGADVRLSPRKSFEAWQEVVSGRSRPWEVWQEDVAAGLRAYVTSLLLQRSREHIAVAESLQRSVLPGVVPSYDGLELSVHYTPASSYQLGGDWWDTLRLDADRVAVVVGDVAGHGVAAVAAMTQVRTALRAYLYAGHTPAAALDLLDRLLADHFGEQVATVVLAVVDVRTRQVEICVAGHPPPLLFDHDRIELVVQPRPLLGLGSGTAVAVVVDLPPDATLLLYTDGLVERRGTDLAASLLSLGELTGSGPGDGTLDSWIDAVVAGVPGETDDDTTVLAVRLP